MVGRPIIPLLILEYATLVACNEYTVNIQEVLATCDVAIVAVGKKGVLPPLATKVASPYFDRGWVG